MDKGRHPNVVRTWTVERARQQQAHAPVQPVPSSPRTKASKPSAPVAPPKRNP